MANSPGMHILICLALRHCEVCYGDRKFSTSKSRHIRCIARWRATLCIVTYAYRRAWLRSDVIGVVAAKTGLLPTSEQ